MHIISFNMQEIEYCFIVYYLVYSIHFNNFVTYYTCLYIHSTCLYGNSTSLFDNSMSLNEVLLMFNCY